MTKCIKFGKEGNDMKKDYSAKFVVIILIVLIAVLAIYFILPQIVFLPKLSIAGLIPVDVNTQVGENSGTVILSNNCYAVSAVVEREQAVSIYNGLNKVVGPRPNVHDLMKDLTSTMKIKVLMVKITELKDSAYHSKIIMQKDNTLLNLDVRPSDGIAIALRQDYKVPIYFNETLFKEQAVKIC